MEQTHSIKQLVLDIDAKRIALPEFQRDFVWEISKTFDLFDSLVKDIFIGAIIYGVPSFEIAVRDVDFRQRPKQGKKRIDLPVRIVKKEEIELLHRINKDNFRLVLDGQQRTTSIYRAIKGIDEVYLIAKNEEEISDNISYDSQFITLEQILYEFDGNDDENRVAIRLSDVWEMDSNDYDEEEIKEKFFKKTAYYRANHIDEYFNEKLEFKKYRLLRKKVSEFFISEKLLSFYLLDMSLDKFVTFFERSNTRGVQLNFIDILAAKLYTGDFNLKQNIKNFEDRHSDIALIPELIVRTMAYYKSSPKVIHRRYILEQLDADDFKASWDVLCGYYKKSIDYLIDNFFVIHQNWMPYDNMLVPLIIFLKEIGGDFHQMSQTQKDFLTFWYWNSIFSLRYSGASNERIIEDAGILTSIAKNKKITSSAWFNKITKIQITSVDDIFSFNKKVNAVYQGVLNLMHFDADGLPDWQNNSKLSGNSELEDHHIFPRNYLGTVLKTDLDSDIVDCVANRTLMPKKLNIKVSDNAPSRYLKLVQEMNPNIKKNLQSHLIPADLLSGEYDEDFNFFVNYRAEQMFELINKHLIKPVDAIKSAHFEELKIDETDNIAINGSYKGKTVEATFNPFSQKVFYKGNIFDSPSAAAIQAKIDCGAHIDNTENGWTWWKYTDEDHVERKITAFRKTK